MIPKEKAKELIDRFTFKKVDGTIVRFDRTKQCALICVDELIKFTIEKKEESMYFEMDLKYWQEVKKEIELC